jgi:hypothetical protein
MGEFSLLGRGSHKAARSRLYTSAMEVGDPRRTFTVEPLEDPVPREAPAPEEPSREPLEAPSEPEKAPA